MRTGLSGFLIAGSLLFGAAQAHAAPKYATYHVNELFITPTKVQTTNSIGDFGTPDKGKTFLVVTFNVVNKDDVENGLGFDVLKLVVNGQSIGEDDFNTPSPSAVDTVLEPGAHATGGVAFDIPVGTHSATLTWAPAAPDFPENINYPTYHWKLSF